MKNKLNGGKKMSKKILCTLLCAVMCIGVFTACTPSNNEDPNAFTVFVPHALPSGYTSYNQLPVYKELEKRTGMKVTYIHGEYADITPLWQGGDYYDVMMMSDSMPGASYTGGQEKGVSDGILWDLTEYIKDHGKDYLSVINDSYTAVQKATITDSGKRIGIYNVPLEEQGPWYGYVMREDWLRAHQESTGIIEKGAAVIQPQTYSEWEAFLTYAKQNCNGGKAPLFLYYTGVDMVGTLNAGYGVSSELYLKNGKDVAYGAIEPQYKEYLDMMKDWYSKGLISTEFAENNSGTESQQPFATAIDNFNLETKAYTPAQYAAFPIIYTYISVYENAMANYTPFYQGYKKDVYSLMPVAAPKKNASDKLHIRYTEKAPGYVAITNKVRSAEKVENIVKWFNYLFTKEGMQLMNYGIEDDTFKMVDGKPTFTEKITDAKKEDGTALSFSDAISTYVALNFVFGYDWKRELQVVTDEEKSAMTEIWNCDNSYVLPTLSPSQTEGKVIEMYQGAAKIYKDEFTVKYIKGEADITFETFVSNMKTTYKVEDLIRVNKDAYERYKLRGGN